MSVLIHHKIHVKYCKKMYKNVQKITTCLSQYSATCTYSCGAATCTDPGCEYKTCENSACGYKSCTHTPYGKVS